MVTGTNPRVALLGETERRDKVVFACKQSELKYFSPSASITPEILLLATHYVSSQVILVFKKF